MLGVLLLLGALCGVLWSLVVTPAEFTKLASGAAMDEDQLGSKFDADAWYVVLAVPTGLVAGFVLSWWRSRDVLLASGLLVLGTAVAAAAMAVVGHLLGPGDPRAALAVAKIGDTVPEQLDVDTFIVFLAWPVGALAGALLVLLGRVREDDVAATPAEPSGSEILPRPAG
jgi:hypothetical protein